MAVNQDMIDHQLISTVKAVCPTLRSFSMKVHVVDIYCPQLRASDLPEFSQFLSNLTHLHISLPVDAAMAAIRSCSSRLISAQLELNQLLSPPADNGAPTHSLIHFPVLAVLAINTTCDLDGSGYGVATLSRVLDQISAPYLCQLVISLDDIEESFDGSFAPSLQRLIAQLDSAQSLKHLSLRGLSVDDYQLLEIFEATDGLTDLVVEEKGGERIITDSMMRTLTWVGGGVTGMLCLESVMMY
ncbi:hypothetical protein VNI00_017048 [Paramarasmius palmivorus]|uniref:Uncharacterized protein n=1 Tax=Paramarasmius palmivorus TaxID=297713 RepID=A0AAW0B7Q1_9AGAR